ncbi:MAG TPA: DUF1189 family protein, partial [Candidatus Bathyarchaeia archaeon]|nr:DUF1189 family protein [Candidatus Bathyarchaeia archaeon]
RFWQVFKNSAFKPTYYKDVLKARFSFSLKYFIVLFGFLSFLTCFTIAFFLWQKADPFLKQMESKLPEFYPEELEIQIKDGQVFTNVTEPYFVALNPDFFPKDIKQGLENQPLQNILVIDTLAQATDIRKYQTFALLTKTDVAFMAENNEIRVYGLEEIKDFSLNQQQVNQALGKITPYLKKIIPFLILLTFLVVPPTTILLKFSSLVFFALLALLMARLFKHRQVTYIKALQVNLHAITLPTIITAVFQFFGAFPKVPMFGTIILFIFNLIIFASLREK